MSYNTLISIIIPTYNSQPYIAECLHHLMICGKQAEIIIVDGGSEDSTIAMAQDFPVKIYSTERGEAVQKNLGAEKATRDILYFLNPNTFPPERFVEDIYGSLLQGYDGGCFRVRYADSPWQRRIEKVMSRVHLDLTGTADQSLFIFRSLFQELGGFDETMGSLEDFDFVSRLRQGGYFQVLPEEILVFPVNRKDRKPASGKLSKLLISQMYHLGYRSEMLKNTYIQKIKKLK